LTQYRQSRDYALYLFDNGHRPGYPDPDNTYPAIRSTNPGNSNKVGDAELDRLMTAAQSAAPGEESAKAWSALQAYEVQLIPHVQIVTYKYIEAYSKKLVDYKPSPAADAAGLEKAWLAV
jgi:hypothetical protein